MRACMPANFLHAITKHTMEIRQDTEEYRHLTFSKKSATTLVAAMRCYIASKLGNTVEVPDDLT